MVVVVVVVCCVLWLVVYCDRIVWCAGVVGGLLSSVIVGVVCVCAGCCGRVAWLVCLVGWLVVS